MPDSLFDDPRLQQAQQTAQQTGQQAYQAEQAGITLPDKLREVLNKKFSMESPVIKQRESALQNYLVEAERAPQTVLPEQSGGVVFNPLEQGRQIELRRAAALAPLTSANALYGQQVGGLESIIGEASRAYQSSVVGLQQRAQLERQRYQDILSELSAQAENAFKEQQFQEQVRQFDLEYQLKRKQGLSPFNFPSNQPSEPKPTSSPRVYPADFVGPVRPGDRIAQRPSLETFYRESSSAQLKR